jgi:ligand-binding SRPBCC domain-containing protein
MATADHSISIDAPAATVFGYLTDPENATVWQSSLLEARFSPDGPVQKGTRISEVRKVLGRRIESEVEVTEVEPSRTFAGRVVSGPVPWEFRYTFDEANGGTRLSFHMEGEPGGFFRLAEPLVVKIVTKQIEGDFATLKELLEGGAS